VKATTRDRIVVTAFELFEERGFEATTVDDIAERAQVGRTTFFRHFPSKEDVIFPDHDRVLAAVHDRLMASTPQTAVVGVSEAARLVLLNYLAEGDRARSRYRLTSTVPALRDREAASMRQYQRLFREFIHGWLGGSPETALRAELMANAVVTAHNHVLRRWLRAETDTPEAVFDAAMAEVVHAFDDRSRPTGDGESPEALVVLRTDKDLHEVLPRIKRLLR
jgi:AcrR family transcriptional regulator